VRLQLYGNFRTAGRVIVEVSPEAEVELRDFALSKRYADLRGRSRLGSVIDERRVGRVSTRHLCHWAIASDTWKRVRIHWLDIERVWYRAFELSCSKKKRTIWGI
jgi:hypothetical protein